MSLVSNTDHGAALRHEDDGRRLRDYVEQCHLVPTTTTTTTETSSTLTTKNDHLVRMCRRVDCCGSSRSIYCPECFQILVPSEYWPQSFILERNTFQKQHQDDEDDNDCEDETAQERGRDSSQLLQLPFAVHIILGRKERRTSSTGVHLMSICRLIKEQHEQQEQHHQQQKQQRRLYHDRHQEQHLTKDKTDCNHCIATENQDVYNDKINDDEDDDGENGSNQSKSWWEDTQFIDLNRIPNGDDKGEHNNTTHSNHQYDKHTTFILFPSKDSVPISSVSHHIKTLIVLDCKWSTSGGVKGMNNMNHDHRQRNRRQQHDTKPPPSSSSSSLSSWDELQFVHLEHPPKHSLFWRWHHLDDVGGMLSTIEAIYFAAKETMDTKNKRRRQRKNTTLGGGFQQQQQQNEEGNDENNKNSVDVNEVDNNSEVSDTAHDSLLDIMWIFALQREMIRRSREEHKHEEYVTSTNAQPNNDEINNVTASKTNNDNKDHDSNHTLTSAMSNLLPFTPEAKEHQRQLRHRKDGKDESARRKRQEKQRRQKDQRQQIHNQQQHLEVQ